MKKQKLLELIVSVLEQEKETNSNWYMYNIYRNRQVYKRNIWEIAFNQAATAYFHWDLELFHDIIEKIGVYGRKQVANFTLFKQTNLWYMRS